MNLLIVIALSVTIVLLIEGGYLAWTTFRDPEQKRIRSHLRKLALVREGGQGSIVRQRVFSDVPWIDKILARTPGVSAVALLLVQANSRYSVGAFLALSMLLPLIGLVLGPFLLKDVVVSTALALGLGATPFVHVYWQKKRRMQRFEQQLPEALELTARALKAGHAFMVGLQMAANEFPDPIGVEFEKTVDEINFGLSVSEALTNLQERVDCRDLRFFVTAVIVQRETGGNLAEIIESLSRIIRQRFAFFGRVRALAAEGKLSAILMIALPFFMAFVIHLLNPGYIALLFTDSLGNIMVVAGGLLMIAGAMVVIKMVRIQV